MAVRKKRSISIPPELDAEIAAAAQAAGMSYSAWIARPRGRNSPSGRARKRSAIRGGARPVYAGRDRRGRRMGYQGHPAIQHPADRMTGVTYDSGVLIAAERGERLEPRARHLALLLRRVVTDNPRPVIAQCWRGAPRQAQLARFLAGCEVDGLDDTGARATGTLAGRARTSDIVDAHVVEGALRRGDLIVSSDESDLAAIAAAVGRHIDIDRPDTPTLAISPGGEGPPSADRRRCARPRTEPPDRARTGFGIPHHHTLSLMV